MYDIPTHFYAAHDDLPGIDSQRLPSGMSEVMITGLGVGTGMSSTDIRILTDSPEFARQMSQHWATVAEELTPAPAIEVPA